MRIYFTFLLTLLAAAALMSGCGSTPQNTTNNSAAPANANAKTPMPVAVVNDAPTLSPLFKSYCEAKVKGDEAALRKVYSTATLKAFDEEMKEEKIKSLVKYLETDKVTPALCTIKNETITGDSAVAEIQFETYPNGIKVVFVKENGEWKLTNGSPTIDSVKAAANSNAAK